MSILFLISSEGYYGAENMVVTLARELDSRGFDCVLAVFNNSQAPHTEVAEQARRHGLPVEIVPCQGKGDLQAVRHLRTLLATHKVSIVHAHGYKADIYAYAAAWPDRAALVATSHNWTNRFLRMRAYAAVDCLVLRRFDEVIVVSDVVGEKLRHWGVDVNKLSTVCNGINVRQFQGAKPTLRKENSSEGSVLVGFVGRLVTEKGGEHLLRAAKQVVAVYPYTKFVFVGDGPARQEWERLSSQLEIAEHVWFTGRRDDMAGVYASLDIVVLPSLLEAQPMCLLEAMAAGKPVIATHVGAVSKVVTSGETGLLLQPGDVGGLAGAIVRLIKYPEFASLLAERGQAHVSKHFSSEAMTRGYIASYQRALGRRGTTLQGQAKWETN
jgi:glycosyltransferase involved in cell wall biosynthesis